MKEVITRGKGEEKTTGPLVESTRSLEDASQEGVTITVSGQLNIYTVSISWEVNLVNFYNRRDVEGATTGAQRALHPPVARLSNPGF